MSGKPDSVKSRVGLPGFWTHANSMAGCSLAAAEDIHLPSQIDPESEKVIIGALQKFLEGRTLILITHRFSLIRLVDDVIVLDHGHLIEEGTVDSLLHKDGKFANLYIYQRIDDEVL